jgi:hypothetical protein
VVPAVNIGANGPEKVDTFGIWTTHRFSIIPSLNVGQLDTYDTVRLTGTASWIFF